MVVESARQSGKRGVVSFVKAYLPLFSLNFLGLAAVRIWLQCSIYDRYLSTDSGFITVVANFVRVALIAVMLGIAFARGFREGKRRTLEISSAVAMTAASVLFLLNLETGSTILLWPACLLAGFGIIWGGGVWMRFYERLEPGEALFCAFFSLALSCVAGFFLGLIPENVTHLVGVLMPVTSLLAYRRSMAALDEREEAAGGAENVRAAIARVFGSAEAPSGLYDKEPASTFVRLILGVALFNLALGLARGFPYGDPIPLSVGFQALHQFGACLLYLAILWAVVVRRRGVRFSTLWLVSISFIVVGVLLLGFANEGLMPAGAAFISIANTFTLGVLWYGSYDLGRHLGVPSYAVLGVAWIAHLLPREIGRSVIWTIGPSDQLTVGVTVAMVVLIAVSIGFILNDSIPASRPFFADLRGGGRAFRRPEAAGTAKEAAGAEPGEAPLDGREEKPALDAFEESLARLKSRYFLTEREVEVARLLAQGRSKGAIAERLFLSENTVRTHTRNLYAKLDVHSRQELLDAMEEERGRDA